MTPQNQNQTPSSGSSDSEPLSNRSARDGSLQEQTSQLTQCSNDNNNNNNNNNITNGTIERMRKHSSHNEIINEILTTSVQLKGTKLPHRFWDDVTEVYNDIMQENFKKSKITSIVKTLRNKALTQDITPEQLPSTSGIQAQSEQTSSTSTPTCPASEFTSPISDPELFRKVKKLMKENIKQAMENVERKGTRKVQHKNVNNTVLNYINKVISTEIVQDLKTLKQINDVIYAAQLTYETVTEVEKEKSHWKEDIQRQIDEFRHEFNILTRKPPDKAAIKKVCEKHDIHSSNISEVKILIDSLDEKAKVFEDKIVASQNRIKRFKANRAFELNRKQFYRDLQGSKNVVSEDIDKSKVLTFWEDIWSNPNIDDGQDYQELIETLDQNTLEIDLDKEKIKKIAEVSIKNLPNWKAAGPDKVFNFFIKKLCSLHPVLIEAIADAVLNPELICESFYTGNSHLLAKVEVATEPEELRPIMCLPSTLKLVNRVNTDLLYEYCTLNEVMSRNQLGTRRRCQGAKEQILINSALNSHNDNKLCTSWIDVKKAFDSIHHQYLIDCLEALHIPECIKQSVRRLLTFQAAKLQINGQTLGTVQIKNGVIQGDSLSPLLFTLSLEPLSRMLNKKCPQVEGNDELFRNHLIFVDDIKLFAISQNQLELACSVTAECLKKMSLKVNQNKSSSNVISEDVFGDCLGEKEHYKYLGVYEDQSNFATEQNKRKVKKQILKRTEELCTSTLYAKNLMKGINEYAISSINYYVGLLNYDVKELEDLDKDIRRILEEKGMLRKSSNIERLYLPRSKLGRGLKNIVYSSENMLANLHIKLKNENETLPIINSQIENDTLLGSIMQDLDIKYEIRPHLFSNKTLKEAQEKKLEEKINAKPLHCVLYKNEQNHLDFFTSSAWIMDGQHSPKDEAAWFKLQDRNEFFYKDRCPHCRSRALCVDHLATRCEMLVSLNYKERHDSIVKSIHLSMANKYGFTKNQKISKHKIEPILNNHNALIKSDLPLRTRTKLDYNRPDIFVLDYRKKEIIIVEIGVTNSETLVKVEIEKARKYQRLAEELKIIHGAKTAIIVPIVLSWDGIVTNHFHRHAQKIGLEKRILSYIQKLAIKSTAQFVAIDGRQQHSHGK